MGGPLPRRRPLANLSIRPISATSQRICRAMSSSMSPRARNRPMRLLSISLNTPTGRFDPGSPASVGMSAPGGGCMRQRRIFPGDASIWELVTGIGRAIRSYKPEYWWKAGNELGCNFMESYVTHILVDRLVLMNIDFPVFSRNVSIRDHDCKNVHGSETKSIPHTFINTL